MYLKLIILAALIALSGCATSTTSTTDFNFTAQEKQSIEEGKLIKPESLSATDDGAHQGREV